MGNFDLLDRTVTMLVGRCRSYGDLARLIRPDDRALGVRLLQTHGRAIFARLQDWLAGIDMRYCMFVDVIGLVGMGAKLCGLTETAPQAPPEAEPAGPWRGRVTLPASFVTKPLSDIRSEEPRCSEYFSTSP